MKANKHTRIFIGVMLHTVKMLLFWLNDERKRYNYILSNMAAIRANEKSLYRSLYMSSITGTPLKLN